MRKFHLLDTAGEWEKAIGVRAPRESCCPHSASQDRQLTQSSPHPQRRRCAPREEDEFGKGWATEASAAEEGESGSGGWGRKEKEG